MPTDLDYSSLSFWEKRYQSVLDEYRRDRNSLSLLSEWLRPAAATDALIDMVT
jgi:hypothetical protein